MQRKSIKQREFEHYLRKEEYAGEHINMKRPKYPRKTKVANDCGVM